MAGKRTPRSASSARVGSGALHGVSVLQSSAPGSAPRDVTRTDKAGSPPRHNALTARQGRIHQTQATVTWRSVRGSATWESFPTSRGSLDKINANRALLLDRTTLQGLGRQDAWSASLLGFRTPTKDPASARHRTIALLGCTTSMERPVWSARKGGAGSLSTARARCAATVDSGITHRRGSRRNAQRAAGTR